MKFKLCLILLLSCTTAALAQPMGNFYHHKDTSKQVSRSVLRTTATEICNNNIDDDNNGLTDDQDFACYFNGFTATNCKSNSVVWSVSGNGDLYWFDLKTRAQHVVGKLPMILVDVSWASNGKLYGIGGSAPYIFEIDPYTAALTPVNNAPTGYFPGNSLTADALGNLYMSCSSGSNPFLIVKFNIATGETCVVADLGGLGVVPAGDLTFLNGILYQSSHPYTLIRIDIRSGTIKRMPLIGTTKPDLYGLVSMPDGYLYTTNGPTIYRIDPVTMTIDPNPVIVMNDRSLFPYGLTAYNELCQAPACPGKTTIEAAGNPPYCNTVGILLKGSVTPVTCGGRITDISWTTANGTTVPGDKVRAFVPGKYYLNFQTTTETCNRMDSITVLFPPNAPLAVDTSYQLPIGCNCNGSITVIAGCGSGNYQYSWSTGAATPTINNVCPGTYTVKVTDAGSGNDTTVRIVIPPSANGVKDYSITATGDHCNQGDGSIHIANIQGGTPPYQYAINNQPYSPTPNFARLPNGLYTVTVTDAVNCALQQQVTISPVAGPQKLSYTKQDAYCGLLTGTVTIDHVTDGSPPFTFALNNGAFNPQSSFSNLLPGPGNITVKDNYGCTLNEPFTIFQSAELRIAISPKDTNICASQSVTFKATLLSNSAGVSYSWNGSVSTGSVFTTPFYDHSKMIVKATDNTGCIAVDSANITAPYCDSIFAKCVLFPNAFSPNRDGLNDSFGPHLGGCEFKSYQLSVYNRWGQLIFQTNNPAKRWDGGVNGQLPQNGTYIYTCQWQDIVGHAHNHKGAIVLLR